MSYTYDLSPATSFEDRYSQFIAFGIPKADVDTLRTTIKDMWADAPAQRLGCARLLLQGLEYTLPSAAAEGESRPPRTEIAVSSTLHDGRTARHTETNDARIRVRTAGPSGKIVVCDTTMPRSAIIATRSR
jgi:hypothetical protein